MSAPILGGMANFANNFTKAYGSEKRRLSDEDERQAEREWRNEQRANQRNEWKEQNQLKTALKDAGAVRNVEQGTVVDAQTGAGPMQRTFTQNPEEASRVKAMMDAEAEMTGAAPAMTQQGTAVTGKMSQGHQISTGPAAGPMANMSDPNSNEEVAKRTAQAYRQNGQMDKAMQMENAIMDQQAKRLGMDIDQLKFADIQTNRALESALKSGSTWYEGAAKFVTDLQSAGMKDVKAEHQLSPDGKSVTLFAVMPDGKKHATGTYPADESGKSQFMDKFAALPVEKRMDIMRDKLKADKEDSRWERTFDFNRQKNEDDKAYKNRVLGFQAAADRRAAETHKIAMDSEKVPAAVKLQATSLSKEMESISSAMNKAMAEGSFNPESANAKALIERQAMLGIKYRQLLEPHMPGGKEKAAADPLGLDKPAPGAAPAGAAAPQAAPKPTAPATPSKPVATMAPKAPLRTTDGGKTWTLDVPETIRDTSVSHYRLIPNPAFAAIGNKSFGSADEARAAFAAMQQ